jgi:hypothetical protein
MAVRYSRPSIASGTRAEGTRVFLGELTDPRPGLPETAALRVRATPRLGNRCSIH